MIQPERQKAFWLAELIEIDFEKVTITKTRIKKLKVWRPTDDQIAESLALAKKIVKDTKVSSS